MKARMLLMVMYSLYVLVFRDFIIFFGINMIITAFGTFGTKSSI